jgi:hypothetical protein
MDYISILELDKDVGDAINYVIDTKDEFYIFTDAEETDTLKTYYIRFTNGYESDIVVDYEDYSIWFILYDNLGNILQSIDSNTIYGEHKFTDNEDTYTIIVETIEPNNGTH